MQGRSCGLFNCSPIYYYKYCGLIIQFNVKLTIISLTSNKQIILKPIVKHLASTDKHLCRKKNRHRQDCQQVLYATYSE